MSNGDGDGDGNAKCSMHRTRTLLYNVNLIIDKAVLCPVLCLSVGIQQTLKSSAVPSCYDIGLDRVVSGV